MLPSTLPKSISFPQIRSHPPLLRSERSTTSAIANFSFSVQSGQNDTSAQPNQCKEIPNVKKERHVHFSDATLSPAVCRICHGGEASCPYNNGEPLISACHCSGSMGLYHRRCLETWLSTSNRDKCEICKFQYQVERRPKSFKEFIFNPGDRSIHRNMVGDMICLIVLTPMALASIWLCMAGAIAVAHHSTDAIAVPGLISLALFLVLAYFVWLLVSLRYHIHVWKDWQRTNHTIRLVIIDNHGRANIPRSTSYMASNRSPQEQVPLQPLPGHSRYFGNTTSNDLPRLFSGEYTNLAFAWETMV